MADASQNKPTKEFLYAIVGVVLFLIMVLLIAISAYLRPGGDHPEDEPAQATAEVAEEGATTDDATDQTPAEEATSEDSDSATAEETASETPEDTAEVIPESTEGASTEEPAEVEVSSEDATAETAPAEKAPEELVEGEGEEASEAAK